ncbi:aminotransferase class I/II-fold pyridoxal phosphate-dependent enzyme [Kurthia massiliensis]|uniref:methionine gamma-lyase family protein n=1 Tax=Kurthia massiliensis TaxID=1033739 RepID=UPI000288066A|nr:methionine gamma-lyase family protein [Kurthia massiliensis]
MPFQSPLTAETLQLAKEIEQQVRPQFDIIEENAFYNQQKVLAAFRNNHVSENHFNGTTGYGYDDEGRDNLERVYAEVFGAEAALVRQQIISGTHAITLSLFGVLRPGDELMYITGKPYDTLQSIVDGGDKDTGSLKDWGISYQHIDLNEQNKVDFEAVERAISEKTKVVAIQRSKGYATRPSFTIDEVAEMIQKVRAMKEDVIIFVDNCYGEFVDRVEPIELGADLMAGSLIKNPGGGLAKVGGYIAGRADLVEKCAFRMTTPGIGAEAGPSLNTLTDMYQGFFLSPHVVSQALKGAVFTAAILEREGMIPEPRFDAKRTDLIQSISFKTPAQMIEFCQVVQRNSPVNAQFAPEPSLLPGYTDEVIMAAGTFVQGASMEFSADGPIRAPYTVYMQGGLTYEHVKTAILSAVQQMK